MVEELHDQPLQKRITLCPGGTLMRVKTSQWLHEPGRTLLLFRQMVVLILPRARRLEPIPVSGPPCEIARQGGKTVKDLAEEQDGEPRGHHLHERYESRATSSGAFLFYR